MEKLYGELIMCIIKGFREEKIMDHCFEINSLLSSIVFEKF